MGFLITITYRFPVFVMIPIVHAVDALATNCFLRHGQRRFALSSVDIVIILGDVEGDSNALLKCFPAVFWIVFSIGPVLQ